MRSLQRRRALRALGTLTVLAAAGVATSALSQEPWPGKPVRFIVPSSPGGGTDLYARLLAQALSERLKQQFVIENRPGASGNIGAAVAAKAAADGYTFLVSANPALTINPSLYKNLAYDPERDFVPVARVLAPLVLIVNPATGIRSLQELIDLGRREPGKIAYGSAGTGSPTYLGVRMIEEKTGARFLHVAYKGVGPAYQDLLGGTIQFLLPDIASALSHIKAGKVNAIAVDVKSPLIEGVPTIAEAGLPEHSAPSTFTIVAPSATPSAIVARISREITAIYQTPAIASRLEAQGLVPMVESPSQLAAAMQAERQMYSSFIKRNGIVATD